MKPESQTRGGTGKTLLLQEILAPQDMTQLPVPQADENLHSSVYVFSSESTGRISVNVTFWMRPCTTS